MEINNKKDKKLLQGSQMPSFLQESLWNCMLCSFGFWFSSPSAKMDCCLYQKLTKPIYSGMNARQWQDTRHRKFHVFFKDFFLKTALAHGTSVKHLYACWSPRANRKGERKFGPGRCTLFFPVMCPRKWATRWKCEMLTGWQLGIWCLWASLQIWEAH